MAAGQDAERQPQIDEDHGKFGFSALKVADEGELLRGRRGGNQQRSIRHSGDRRCL
jgi:hypothetical protein